MVAAPLEPVQTAAAGPTARRSSWFVPLESKLHIPASRPSLVRRERLLEQLAASRSSSTVAVIGPPGYGKTTLLTQWGEIDERPFVWVTVDRTDNDPSRLLTYIVLALDAPFPLGPGIFPRPAEPGEVFSAFVLPRLMRALSKRATPFVLVLDDVHELHDADALETIATLVQNLPAGSQVVLAGRELPPIRLSGLLVDNSMLALGIHQLAFTPPEGAELLQAAGLRANPSESALLVERTEGWAAALYLAAVALNGEPHLGDALAAFAGDDELLTRYLRDEMLLRLSEERLEFMLGTAALDRLCGPLCDAVLGTTGSADLLSELAGANQFLVPSDRNGVWYRRHQLFSEMLQAELRRRDPSAEREQHRRAAAWYERAENPDAALEHALAADDVELAAAIIARHVAPYLGSGRAAAVRRWIETLPKDRLLRLPWFGAAAALAYVSSGDVERATQWLAVAERGEDDGPTMDGRSSLRSAVAISRAALGLGGAPAILHDATIGYELESGEGPWRGFCAFLQGAALTVLGDVDGARSKLNEARALTGIEQPNVYTWTLAQLAVLEIAAGEWETGRELAERARIEAERHGLQEYATTGLVYAASAVTCAHSRQPAEARRDATRASRLLTTLSGLAPWIAVEGRLMLADAYLLLGAPAEARESLHLCRRHLARLGDSPVLHDWFERSTEASAAHRNANNGPPLTAAEIRVLQFLPTHLSFREIAERLHVSRNTVKTQVISSYRKLGASNRTEAVGRARDLSLISTGEGAEPLDTT
jgi:LuxR family maltose regulon positive regulatory protein